MTPTHAPPPAYRPFNFETHHQSENDAVDHVQQANEAVTTSPKQHPGQGLSPSSHLPWLQPAAQAVHVSQIPPALPPHTVAQLSPAPSPFSRLPFAPTPPRYYSADTSTTDLYGPDRLAGPPFKSSSAAPVPSHQPSSHSTIAPSTAMVQHNRFAEAQRKILDGDPTFNQSILASFREPLVVEAGKITPGIDETPYLLYALDAITKDHNDLSTPPQTSPVTGIYSYPSPRPVYDRVSTPVVPESRRLVESGSQLDPQLTPTTPANTTLTTAPHLLNPKDDSDAPAPHITTSLVEDLIPRPPTGKAGAATSSHPLLSVDDSLPFLARWTARELWHKSHVQPLDYKPWLLHMPALLLGALLSIVVAVLTIVTAGFSSYRTGLVNYDGSIYGWQWLVFRILPQLVALGFVQLAQAVVATAYRLEPFRMLSADADLFRQGALLRDTHMQTFLWPTLQSSWEINIPIMFLWISYFLVPLSCGMFSVVLKGETWRWAVVQGVAWTVMVFYLMLAALFLVLLVVWRRKETGLMWDPCSLADTIALFARSNNTGSFEGLDGPTSTKLRFAALFGTAQDRLAWWRDYDDTRGTRWWHSLGVSYNHASFAQAGLKKAQYASINDPVLHHDLKLTNLRRWYLPWMLRTVPLLVMTVTMTTFVIVIFVVSFLRSTSLSAGFVGGVEPAPKSGAFSAANFLWSFVPSLLGMVLWLLWLSLDHQVRLLTPWAELRKPGGAPASRSLLADYAAAPHPMLAAISALKHKQWRVVITATLSTTLAFLPVVAGGLFMALTNSQTWLVRMNTNSAAYGVLLGMLVLYCFAFASLLVPGRSRMRMPHAVDSLAETYSFCVDHDLLADPAFHTAAAFDHTAHLSSTVKRTMMVEELTGKRKNGGQKRFTFGRRCGRWGVFVAEEDAGGVEHEKLLPQTTPMTTPSRPKFSQERWGRRASDLRSPSELVHIV